MEKEKKYYKLYKLIKSRILSGEYKSGEKLPSKRTMADMTSVSTITVESAYSRLADEGYIYSKERSGYFVSEIDAVQTKEYTEGRALDFLDEDCETPSRDFEYSVWFKTVRKVMSERGEKLFVKKIIDNEAEASDQYRPFDFERM